MLSDIKLRDISHQIWSELKLVSDVSSNLSSELQIPIGVSNRHVHLNREDMDILFGQGSSLTRMKAVKQPGQFAAEETVTLKGPKKEIHNVRILGPLRPETQVEISIADNFTLGIKAPIKMSGDLVQAEKIQIIGPKGCIEKEHCVIVAWRHVHITPELALQYGLYDGQNVSVQIDGVRGGVMNNVVIRSTTSSVLEMHIDVEEANAYGIGNNSLVTILK